MVPSEIKPTIIDKKTQKNNRIECDKRKESASTPGENKNKNDINHYDMNIKMNGVSDNKKKLVKIQGVSVIIK